MLIENIEPAADLKPDNHARVVWFGESRVRTPVSVLYVHGFSASPMESGDVPAQIAAGLGANLVMARLAGHGVDALVCDVPGLLDSVIEGYRLAERVACAGGRRVVILATSLGASLVATLIADGALDPAALVLWSPGVAAVDAQLLDHLCAAPDFVTDPRPRSGPLALYWSPAVHPAAYQSLRDIFSTNAAANPWGSIECPVMMAYCSGDATGSVPAMLAMFETIPSSRKVRKDYSDGAHVIASPYKSGAWRRVANDAHAFLSEAMGIGDVNQAAMDG